MKVSEIDPKIKLKVLGLILTVLALGALAGCFAPWIIEKVKQPEVLRDYLRSFEGLGILFYVLLQAVHVLIVVIPGDLFNVCGGYIYGIPLGFVLSMTGIMIGTVCAFYISRLLGFEFISKIVPKDKIDKISSVLNSTKGMLGMLIVCLIPGIPKDLMIYVAGLSPVNASKLFLVYGVSRIPGTLIWVSVGAQVYERNAMEIAFTLIGTVLIASAVIILQNKYKLAKNNEIQRYEY